MSKEELIFSSETEALQYLSNLTGKRVKVAVKNITEKEALADPNKAVLFINQENLKITQKYGLASSTLNRS